MDSIAPVARYSYTKEELIAIRDAYLINEDLDRYPVKKSSISIENPSSKSLRKTHPLKMEDETNVYATDEASPVGAGDTPSVSLQPEPRGLWRRSTGLPNSPGEVSSRAPYVRHSSGSSVGDEGTVTGGKDGVDWSLGCGKWRHRSKSGSERGNKTFFPSSSRGRGRGDGNEASFTYGRGRGFVRRPYQPFTMRGRGFKSFNSGYHQAEQSDEFWNHDDWKADHGTGSPSDHYNHPRPGSDDVVCPPQNSSSWTHVLSKFDMDRNNGIPQETLSRPPGITGASPLQRQLGEVSFMSNFPQHYRHLQQAAVNNVAVEQIAAIDRPAPTLWFYLDSAGTAQGPYDDATMANWFTTGHFPISVEVKRKCDKVFYRLTDFITWMNRFPFVNSHQLPPILESQQTSAPSIPAQSLPAPAPLAPLEFDKRSVAPQANTSIVDLNSLTEATLNEVMQLQQDAKRLMERASALGADHAKLIGNFAALSIENSTIGSAPSIPVTESAVMQSGEIAASVSFPETLTTVQQLPVELKVPTSTLDSEQKDHPAPCKKKQKKKTGKIYVKQSSEADDMVTLYTTEPISSVPVSVKTSNPNKQNKIPQTVIHLMHETPPLQLLELTKIIKPSHKNVLPQMMPSVPEATIGKRNKRQKKKLKSVSEIEEKEEEEKSVAVEPISLVDDDWDSVSDPAFEPYQCQTVQQLTETVPTKKSKKKKKSKPTAAELKQQAWQQEEERRKKQMAERLAQAEAEAIRLVEEKRQLELIETAEAKKAELAAHKELMAARHREEMRKRQTAAEMSNLKLPPTTKWGANSSDSGVPSGPIQLVNILADQRQELEHAKAQSGGGSVTFAQKLGSNVTPGNKKKSAKQTTPSVAPPLLDPFLSDAVTIKKQQTSQKVSTNKNQSTTAKQAVQQPAPSKPQKISKASSKVPAFPDKAMASVSIWDLPSDSLGSASQSKKSKKKKANASSKLLTGLMMSLPPNARTDLVKWCESQLSSFPRQNVDLPTLITLLCDIEEAEDVRMCIEASFGKSPLVSKFSKAFVEKRALLMRSSA